MDTWQFRIKSSDSTWNTPEDGWRDVTETTVSGSGYRNGFDLQFRPKPIIVSTNEHGTNTADSLTGTTDFPLPPDL